jgi:Tfp pilus assembly protein PilV
MRFIARNRKPSKKNSYQAGVSILETLIASAVLMIGVAGVMSVFSYAAGTSKGQGDIGTRVVAYTQDKMEQLLSLDYADNSTDTTSTTYPMPATGTGLGGDMAANSTVGGTNTAAPANGYVDYLDFTGNRLQTPNGAFFTRVWSISLDGSKMKTITVVTAAKSQAGANGAPLSATLVCQRTDTR